MNSDPLHKFDLDQYLQRQSAVIDRALEHYLEKYPGESQTIFRAMRYGVFPGGKRIRPILVLAAGELFGAPLSSLLPFACAVEMIHAYSLIHDDLPALDNDDLRRGEPTAHKVFGDGMALLAGDGLLTEAFHLMSSADATRCVAPELTVRLIHELSHAVGVGGLVGGQALDLEAENDYDVDLATVEWIHVRKTGGLILASIRLGAQVACAEPEDLGRITRYGERLGLAFQIADDILDALGHSGAGEGAESSHKERKKATYPSVVGIPQARETLKELLQLCLDEVAPYGAQAVPLQGIARLIVARAIRGDSKPISEETNS
ncbi:MAG TPA: farnesyl diphosphate synthase [Candidatus Binatia bacterium]|jgi:geranylgeranyl diphosphate synthase type II